MFERLLAKVRVLSLDIFDTTLARRCSRPEDVFALMEEQLVRRHGPAFAGYAERRREAEHGARRQAWETRQAEDTDLFEIHSVLRASQPDWAPFPDDLAAMEMELERRMFYPLESARRMIAAARRAGKRVVFTSDMYLPRAFCEECLRASGFTDYDAFFISSEVGKLKHTGSLFTHLLAALQVRPDQVLHVGDNPASDITQAARAGLRTLLVPKAIDQLDRFPGNPWKRVLENPSRTLRESLLLGLSALGCQREGSLRDPFWFRLGYQVGGPLMCGYVQFLLAKLQGRGIGKVYFLSRDGYILKQVYELLAAGRAGCPEPDYLHASRRALNFASIKELDQRTEDWLAEGIRLTIGQFLQRVGMDPREHLADISACGFTGPDQPVVEGRDYANLRALYRRILPALLAAAAAERAVYVDYLRDKGVLTASPFVLVDVGWMTSIQHSFERLLRPERPDLEIEGYYLGSYPDAVHRAGPLSRHVHYLMAYGEPRAAMDTIRHCVALVEFLFAAPEHTFLRMRRGGGGFEPELAPVHENADDLPALAQIHEGILAHARELRAATGTRLPPVEPAEVVALLHRMLAQPTPGEARRLGDLRYADGYGSFFHHDYMARPSGLRALGLSKRRWKAEFKAAHWRRGYAARLGPLERLLFRLMVPNPRYVKPHG